MKPNQLAALALRLLGIFCLVQCLNSVSLLTYPFAYFTRPPGGNVVQDENVQIIFMVAAFLLRILVGYILLTRANAFANRLVPPDAAQPVTASISIDQMQILAFAVVGIVIFADSLPQLSSLMLTIGYRPTPTLVFSRSALFGAGYVAKAALGLWMFLAPGTFVNFWQSFRNFGTPKSANP